jgi:predicted RNase H-like nuclease
VAIGSHAAWRYGLHGTIGELAGAYPEADLTLIDIPIGLPSTTKRRCDGEARRLLGPSRASSIFPVPCRAALAAHDYREACAINKRVLGVELSKQTWNILPKIREVDDWLRQDDKPRLRECHPELAFWAFAGGRIMGYSKKTKEGRDERLALLRAYFRHADDLYAAALSAYTRKSVAADDIIDALALALTARLSGGGLLRVPTHPQLDAMGLPMEMVYAPLHIRAA